MTQGKGNRGKLGSWIAVLAIVALILYVLYVLKWSGNELAAFELAASGGKPTHTVELEAGMSPMRALIETELLARAGPAFAYDVTIHGQDIDGVKEVLVKNSDLDIHKKRTAIRETAVADNPPMSAWVLSMCPPPEITLCVRRSIPIATSRSERRGWC